MLLSLSVSGFEEAVDDMFSYLLSYSALKKLKIPRVQMESQSAEDAARDVFWHAVVPQHKDSLIELAVHPIYEGSWCYGPVAANAIQQCTSLQRLDLHLCSIDRGWTACEIARLQEGGDFEVPDQEYSASEAINHCPVRTYVYSPSPVYLVPITNQKPLVDDRC
jgi:hypothetical protein